MTLSIVLSILLICLAFTTWISKGDSQSVHEQSHAIVYSYYLSMKDVGKHSYNEVGICPLLANIEHTRTFFKGSFALIIGDKNSGSIPLSSSELNILQQMDIKIFESDAVSLYNSSGNIFSYNVESFFASTMLKQHAACLPFDRVLYIDIDNFITELDESKLFDSLYPDIRLVGCSGIYSPLSAGELLIRPRKENCDHMKSSIRGGFTIDRGWNSVGAVVSPWPNCFSSDAEKAVGLLNFNCNQTNWNFYGACIDQGLLYYEYNVIQKSSVLKPFVLGDCVSWEGYFKSRHYQGPKPWNECKHDRDLIWWNAWNNVKTKYPNIESLPCYSHLERKYKTMKSEKCF